MRHKYFVRSWIFGGFWIPRNSVMVVIECVDFPLASFTPNGTWRFLLNADSDRGPSLSSQDVIWIVRSYSWNLFGGLLYARILRRRWERSTICAADRQLKSIHKLIIIVHLLSRWFVHTHTHNPNWSELEEVRGIKWYTIVRTLSTKQQEEEK